MGKFFQNLLRSKKSRARLGKICTDHGTVTTPAFVPVGTKGAIKALLPSLTNEIGIQLAFVNTYHLVTHPGAAVVESAGGIHRFSQLNLPLISDSGGFQVFSLGRRLNHSDQHQRAKVLQDDEVRPERPLIEKISHDGVKFRSVFDGELLEFTPEKSMEYQRQIGADLNMAFDECTYYPATRRYAQQAMERTHEWLKRCIKHKLKTGTATDSVRSSFPASARKLRAVGNPFPPATCRRQNQYLYGVIQGATFEDLRKQSAKFVVGQNTSGVAIGGVSVGESKKEMRDQVRWVADYLPDDRPVHLLGVGQIDDIVDLVRYGIDTFDCVEPTRLARMGEILRLNHREFSLASVQFEKLDIMRGHYRNNLEPVVTGCGCYVCRHFTKAYLHHLFKQREILGYNLATYHNLWVMEKLMELIRQNIKNDQI
ncbi:tRNA-guanine transglycosylase [Patescibacteria group bacterium]|nr:tRNA-guanine transglycosylase [Patescibacteria group bacterium]MCL5091530.1 tRNA-guanine transglycosylase [Patescibacteria group bacterium]